MHFWFHGVKTKEHNFGEGIVTKVQSNMRLLQKIQPQPHKKYMIQSSNIYLPSFFHL